MATILLVDDSPTDRRIIGGILERNGLGVRYAENGSGALKQLQRSVPDAVLTDMQMPEMDGLELVKAIRTGHPEVPVILMTAHGSEQLAAQALQHGAASYVPKSSNALLVESVTHVLNLAQGDANFRRLIDHTTVTDFQFSLDNDPDLIEPLIQLVAQMTAGMQLSDAAGRLQVGVALEQAILNAMFHGNLELTTEQLRAQHTSDHESAESLIQQRRESEPYKDRKCFVRATINRDEGRYLVRDEGPGFDVQNKLDVSVSGDDTAGRGLVLMWGLMDKVVFNKAGNEVTLIKRRKEPVVAPKADEAKPATEKPGDRKKPKTFGQLNPVSGGKPIILTDKRLTVGRDPSCDVVLAYSDVSHQHCLLYMYSGWWYVKDLKSANGVRINKNLVDQKRIAPGSTLSIATHQFEVSYSPWDLGAVGITPPVDPF